MGQVFGAEGNYSSATVTITSATETDVGATPLITVPFPTCRVRVSFYVVYTNNANATTVTPKLYQGANKSGTAKGGSAALTIVTSAVMEIGYQFEEQIAGFLQIQYALSLTPGAGAGNGSVTQWSGFIDLISG